MRKVVYIGLFIVILVCLVSPVSAVCSIVGQWTRTGGIQGTWNFYEGGSVTYGNEPGFPGWVGTGTWVSNGGGSYTVHWNYGYDELLRWIGVTNPPDNPNYINYNTMAGDCNSFTGVDNLGASFGGVRSVVPPVTVTPTIQDTPITIQDTIVGVWKSTVSPDIYSIYTDGRITTSLNGQTFTGHWQKKDSTNYILDWDVRPTGMKYIDNVALASDSNSFSGINNEGYRINAEKIGIPVNDATTYPSSVSTNPTSPTGSSSPQVTQSIQPRETSTAGTQGDFSQVTFLVLIIIIACMMLGGIFIYTKRSSGRLNTVKHSDRTISEPARADSGTKTSMNINDRKNSSFNQDVIISYSSHDKAVADAICNSLESQKIRCWYAPRDILPGMNFQESIIDAIDTSSIMVVIFSSHSNDSPHVISEVTEAMAKGVIIIPFRIEDIMPSKAMKYLISASHWLDAMTPPLEQHIEKLVETVKVLLKKQK